MLTSLFPYLNFDGNAKEATHYYVATLDGELLGITTFGEAPKDDSSCGGRIFLAARCGGSDHECTDQT